MARKPNRVRERRREQRLLRRDRVARRLAAIELHAVERELIEVIPPDVTQVIIDLETRVSGLENP